MALPWHLYFQSRRMRTGLLVSSPAGLGWRIRRHWIFSCSPCGLTGRSDLAGAYGERSNGCYLSEMEGLQAQVFREWATSNQSAVGLDGRHGGNIVKTLLNDESGQTLIFVALSMTVILGFTAMAADVGTLLHDKRNLQIAADSAAIAGAVEEKVSSVTGDIQASGQTASTQNGFTNGSNHVTVTINTPPANGPHAGAAGYVEAIVSQVEPVFFMKLFSFTSMTVTARAVAFDGATSSNCVLATNPTAPQTIELQGSFNANFPGCSVVDDSNDPDALDFTGGGGSLTAGSVGVVGGAGGHTGDSSPAPKTGVAPISDPLASLPPPPYDPASCTAAPSGTAWGPATAGGTVCYSGNIKVQ